MTVIEQEVVSMVPGLVEAIRVHARREADRGCEAVGFLASRVDDSSRVSTLMQLHNHSADPDKAFFVEPWEQFRAETKLVESGYKIVGVYHSHPTSEALPSRADESMARPKELMVIYSVAFDELRAWREHEGKLSPVELNGV